MTVRLTGRGAIVLLFVPCFLGLLLGWDPWPTPVSSPGAAWARTTCGHTAWCRSFQPPPLVFATACVFAEVFTRSVAAIAEGILRMANAAPWLLPARRWLSSVAIGRGVGPQVRSLLGVRLTCRSSRGRRRHALVDLGDLGDVAEAVLSQHGENLGDQFLRHRRAAGQADRRDVVQPGRVDLARVVDQVGGPGAVPWRPRPGGPSSTSWASRRRSPDPTPAAISLTAA